MRKGEMEIDRARNEENEARAKEQKFEKGELEILLGYETHETKEKRWRGVEMGAHPLGVQEVEGSMQTMKRWLNIRTSGKKPYTRKAQKMPNWGM